MTHEEVKLNIRHQRQVTILDRKKLTNTDARHTYAQSFNIQRN